MLLQFWGCSTVQNVQGYFNTYYNTQRLFSEAVDEINRNPQKERDTNAFAPYEIAKIVDDKLEKVIEKASKLIQFYPKSSWIDDAILMIGESYVYKDESESAIRKFEELLENFPESGLRFEGKLWYAKAQYLSRKPDAALALIKDLVPDAEAHGEHGVALEALLLEAQIRTEQEDLPAAIESYGNAAAVDGPGPLRALAQAKQAALFERTGNDSAAAEAYAKVLDHEPDPALKYRARLMRGVKLSALKQYDAALEVFDRLHEEDLRPEEQSLVDLEVANTKSAMGDTAHAFALYNYIDTTYRHSDASAKSAYKRGLYYELTLGDYHSALDCYDRARNDFTGSEITTAARDRFDYMSRYFALTANVRDYDSLLQLALHPDTTQQLSDTAGVYRDSSLSREPEAGRAAVPSVDSLRAASGGTPARPPIPERREVAKAKPAQAPAPAEHSRWFARHGHDEEEEGDDVVPFEESGGAGGSADNVESLRDSLRSARGAGARRILSAGAKVTPDSLRYLIAQSHYELGGLFFLQLHLPDSASERYKRVAADSAPTPFVPRALYALAEVYRTRNDTVAVDSLYMILLARYDTSEYTAHVKKLKNIAPPPKPVDSAAVTYSLAQTALAEGKTDSTLDLLASILRTAPSSTVAPQAQYAIGWIYENVLVYNDSAAAVYRRLLDAYPGSKYAEKVRGKVAVRENPDSLARYVRVKEIVPIAKAEAPERVRRTGTQRGGTQGQGILNSRGRGKDQGVDEDEDQQDDEPEEPDVPDPDDDSGGD